MTDPLGFALFMTGFLLCLGLTVAGIVGLLARVAEKENPWLLLLLPLVMFVGFYCIGLLERLAR